METDWKIKMAPEKLESNLRRRKETQCRSKVSHFISWIKK
jgi:hypothetical protein